jgi:hypothetical protein
LLSFCRSRVTVVIQQFYSGYPILHTMAKKAMKKAAAAAPAPKKAMKAKKA